MQGQAIYLGERVSIIDVLYIPGLNSAEVLINYSGPIWVKLRDLTNITWFIDKTA